MVWIAPTWSTITDAKIDYRSMMFVATEPAMNPWKRLHDEFNALMQEEDRIVEQRGLKDWCYAYVTDRESGEFGGWVASITTEHLNARFELLATEAGIELG